MKTFLAALAAGVLLTHMASAIPQTFNGFLGAVGMPFEQYIGTVAVWSPGAELKGPWKSRGEKKGDVETLDLGVEAMVLGIAGAQVSAERAGGVVRRFTVRFDEGKLKGGKPNPGGLFAQVTANLTALAGEAKSVSSGGEKMFRYESASITARKSGAREVIVEFTRAQ